MSRILRPPDLWAELREMRKRIDQLERGKPQGSQVAGFGFQDPTSQVGDIIERTQFGLSRLPIGLAGEVLTVQNLGNYIQTLTRLLPIAHFRLSEASGTTMADFSGNGHDGTYSGAGVTYHVAPATGDGDFAVSYNGSTGYSQLANVIPNGDCSIVFFFKTTQTSFQRIPIVSTWNGNGGSPNAGALNLGLANDGHISAYVVLNNGPSVEELITPNLYNGGTWHHCVFTRVQASDTQILYIDGDQVATGGLSYPGLSLAQPSTIFFGAVSVGPTAQYNGSLDEVSFFNYVLTGPQVANLYNQFSGIANAIPTWGSAQTGLVDPTTAEGDLIVREGGVPARLPVGGANTVLHGGTDPNYAAVVEADLSLSDVTTDNVSTTKHGFAPKAPNDATKFLDGTGAYSAPSGGPPSAPTNYSLLTDPNQPALIFTNAGDVIWVEC